MTIAPATRRPLIWALFVVQFLTWVGMFMLWVFSLPMIAALEPDGTTGLRAATRTMGLLFALYVGLGAVLAMGLPHAYARFGKARTHGLALLAGAAGLMSVHWITTPGMLFGSYAAVAVGWASISSTPYTLASDQVSDAGVMRARWAFSTSRR